MKTLAKKLKIRANHLQIAMVKDLNFANDWPWYKKDDIGFNQVPNYVIELCLLQYSLLFSAVYLFLDINKICQPAINCILFEHISLDLGL